MGYLNGVDLQKALTLWKNRVEVGAGIGIP